MKLSLHKILLISSSILLFLAPFYFLNLIRIEGSSMEPTIKPNQMAIALGIKNFPITPSSIHVINLPNNLVIIKRIIAGPGDTFYIKNHTIYINQTTTYPINFPDLPEIKIQPGYYFCYGDNQKDSIDSKLIGLIPQKWISGPIVYITPIISN